MPSYYRFVRCRCDSDKTTVINLEDPMNRQEIDQGKYFFYKPDKRRLHRAIANWSREIFVPGEAIAASLQVKSSLAGTMRAIEAGDKTVEHFVKRLNREAYGQRAKAAKGGLQVPLIVIREGGGEYGPALHYHAIIGVPEGKTLEEWKQACNGTWVGMRNSHKYNDFSDYSAPGWADYISKQSTKLGSSDFIVAVQHHINDAGRTLLH
jgi:hypothetical protein